MSDANKVPCPACGGSALSPYPDDGGSCPHCFNGEVEAVEQMRAADEGDSLAESELSNDEIDPEYEVWANL